MMIWTHASAFARTNARASSPKPLKRAAVAHESWPSQPSTSATQVNANGKNGSAARLNDVVDS